MLPQELALHGTGSYPSSPGNTPSLSVFSPPPPSPQALTREVQIKPEAGEATGITGGSICPRGAQGFQKRPDRNTELASRCWHVVCTTVQTSCRGSHRNPLGTASSLARPILKMGNVTGRSLAHHTVPSSPIKGDKQVEAPRGQWHRKPVTAGEEDFQQPRVCDVKQGECGPPWPQRIPNLVQTYSVYDSKAEECISVRLTKTGCGQRAPD